MSSCARTPHPGSRSHRLWSIASLLELAERDRVSEVVLAIEERRGSLPVHDLLQAKLAGVRVSYAWELV